MDKDPNIQPDIEVKNVFHGLEKYKQDLENYWHDADLPEDFKISEIYMSEGPVNDSDELSELHKRLAGYSKLIDTIVLSDGEETPEVFSEVFSSNVSKDGTIVEVCTLCIATENGKTEETYVTDVLNRADQLLSTFGVPKQFKPEDKIL